MKRILFWVGVVVAAFAIAAWVVYGQEAKPKFIVIYTTSVRDYNSQHLMICSTPGCNDVYNQEERHAYFRSVEDALVWMNAYVKVDGFPVSGMAFNGGEKVSSIIGLYEIRQLPATLEKVGSQKVYVQRTVEEERPKLEWKLPNGDSGAASQGKISGILPVGGGPNDTGASHLLGGTIVTVGHPCDESLLWKHIYHPQRLQVIETCATVTGTIVDASHGKNKDGARHEADGDGHFWLKLDAGQEKFLNAENISKQDGNLVFEPVCRYRVTQADAIAACKNYKQPLVVPPVGSHVLMVGDHVLDAQHGHNEFHPVYSIEVIP